METISREFLEKYLSQNLPDIKNKEVLIWGTGNTALLYQEGLHRLKNEGFEIKGYCDNNPQKWGTTFCEKVVVSPKELSHMSGIVVLICTTQPKAIEEIKKQLSELKLDNYLLDEVILKQHKKEVLECYDSLYDEEAKAIYANVIMCRCKGIEEYILEEKEQYFATFPFSDKSEGEVFVDCGAYIGDTIETYIRIKEGTFKKIIAFEPDLNNFQKMNELLSTKIEMPKEKFELYSFGVGDVMQLKSFKRYEDNKGLGSKFCTSVSEDDEVCKIVSLDDFLTEDYTFLKADIESYEYKMLLGAYKSILKNKPLLTICIYHNAVDLYTIPLLVKQMKCGYNLTVRHHSLTVAETVLYAWCDER